MVCSVVSIYLLIIVAVLTVVVTRHFYVLEIVLNADFNQQESII